MTLNSAERSLRLVLTMLNVTVEQILPSFDLAPLTWHSAEAARFRPPTLLGQREKDITSVVIMTSLGQLAIPELQKRVGKVVGINFFVLLWVTRKPSHLSLCPLDMKIRLFCVWSFECT
jgi:hypothetical protein